MTRSMTPTGKPEGRGGRGSSCERDGGNLSGPGDVADVADLESGECCYDDDDDDDDDGFCSGLPSFWAQCSCSDLQHVKFQVEHGFGSDGQLHVLASVG